MEGGAEVYCQTALGLSTFIKNRVTECYLKITAPGIVMDFMSLFKLTLAINLLWRDYSSKFTEDKSERGKATFQVPAASG